MSQDTAQIKTALQHISNEDREIWIRMGGALKGELGDAGFELWNDWSKSGSTYDEHTAKTQWKSFNLNKVPSIGTLFYYAQQNGYKPTDTYKRPSAEELEKRRHEAIERLKKNQALEKQAQNVAAAKAKQRWDTARPADPNHPYLVKKGITSPEVLRTIRQEGKNLLIPVKQLGNIVGVQTISPTGEKWFPKDTQLSGSSMLIGSWSHAKQHGIDIAEGFATAASIHQDTGRTVAVAFIGGNLQNVAAKLINTDLSVTIIADNDERMVNGELRNDGYRYAENAAELLGDRAKIVMPAFSQEDQAEFDEKFGGRASDFNDLYLLKGKGSVQTAISQQLNQQENTVNNSHNQESPTLELTPDQAEDNSISPDLEQLKKKTATVNLAEELDKKLINDLEYDHPPGKLKAKYVVSKKGDYVDHDGVVKFTDKGAKLVSPRSDLSAVKDMLDVAEAKGWNSIKLSGSKEFRRAAFLEANSRGIAVEGYKPTPQDLALLEKLREDKSLNTIDQAPQKAVEQPPPSQTHSERQAEENQERLAASEASKLKAQSSSPTHAQVETSLKADLDNDIPKGDISGNTSVPSEVLVMMQDIKGAGKLSQPSAKLLATHIRAANLMLKMLDKDIAHHAKRNFTDNMEKAINGTTINLPEPIKAKEQTLERTPERKQDIVRTQTPERTLTL